MKMLIAEYQIINIKCKGFIYLKDIIDMAAVFVSTGLIK